MKLAVSVLQVIVALSLLNVWLLRSSRSTAYRGGGARSMREEFAVYGLPDWFTYIVGALKVGASLCLIAGLWVHPLVLPAALLICVLMLGALAMHAKVHDPLKKFAPALIILAISVMICVGSPHGS
jgi:uncharacterized membrane protein YphA (DoxX/SURF4 family)